MNTVKTGTIDDLIPDQKNANKGREFGQHLLEKSLRELGTGRSILTDKHGNVIAGNKTLETAAAIGLNDVIIVPSDGTKLIVVQRTDLDIDSKQGRELAIADNKVSQANLEFDENVLQELGDEYSIDLDAWGFSSFDDEEEQAEKEEKAPKEDDKITFQLSTFQQAELKKALATAKLEAELDSVKETDGEALMVLVKEFLKRRS
ncbi:ParB N-terminal domain-containing protein [Spirosoma endbachense]|uniref:ParB/Sulfiredoxin domain-containing protein n=1 Tax=Spirosoma endbachense TaxID=2666025 RepID=A0A6P1W1A2_9BACT|nr:hypothetical protein [Spirosoma endbachense]QHV99211.1 hypothetical protein GJR95_31230 [Spirosoma endbachense]